MITLHAGSEKGTHFALDRVTCFLREHYRKHGATGYVLKCDIAKFFDNIDHAVLKKKLEYIVSDQDVLNLLYLIIDSFESAPGKGIPMGNQTSQWFAILYLDTMDRLIKEKYRIRHYSRYMDDFVLLHRDKGYLQQCLSELRSYANDQLYLHFNTKTQICPLRNGINYLGWHFYLTETGKVIRKIAVRTKRKYKRRLKKLQKEYKLQQKGYDQIKIVLNSYHAHLQHGHTYRLRTKVLSSFALTRSEDCQ